jgi:hypothetical protein
VATAANSSPSLASPWELLGSTGLIPVAAPEHDIEALFCGRVRMVGAVELRPFLG